MNNEKTIACKITSEMIHYFYRRNVLDLEIKLNLTAEAFELRVTGKASSEDSDFTHFIDQLNQPRLPEMDDYYSQLLGASETLGQLHVLSGLIDEAFLSQDDTCITITIKRRLQ